MSDSVNIRYTAEREVEGPPRSCNEYRCASTRRGNRGTKARVEVTSEKAAQKARDRRREKGRRVEG
jgi:hypothetical protein